MKRLLMGLIVAPLLLLPVKAEPYQDIGHYRVHYNAFISTFLSPEMATFYDIRRSKVRAILTVSVLERNPDPGKLDTPVQANVTGYAVNLARQLKALDFREIRDGTAVYYIAEFRVADKETLDFTVKVSPEGKAEGTIHFTRQFFTD